MRRALLRRVDHVWDQGWLNLIGIGVVGFFLFLTLPMLTDGIGNVRAEKWGVGGTLTIDRCTIDEWGKNDPWWCHGTFVSSDGTLRISRVRYERPFEGDPQVAGEPLSLDARVVGPGTSSAWPPGDEWKASLIVGAFLLFVTGMVFLWFVNPDDSAAPASHSPGVRRGRRTRKVRRSGPARRHHHRRRQRRR